MYSHIKEYVCTYIPSRPRKRKRKKNFREDVGPARLSERERYIRPVNVNADAAFIAALFRVCIGCYYYSSSTDRVRLLMLLRASFL